MKHLVILIFCEGGSEPALGTQHPDSDLIYMLQTSFVTYHDAIARAIFRSAKVGDKGFAHKGENGQRQDFSSRLLDVHYEFVPVIHAIGLG